MVPLRFISCLVNSSTSSLFLHLHWLAFLPSIRCHSSLFKTLPGLPHEAVKLLAPVSALKTVPVLLTLLLHLFLRFSPGVSKVPCNPGRAALLVPPRLALKFPLAVIPVGQQTPQRTALFWLVSVPPRWCLLGSHIWGDRAHLAFITQKWSLGSNVLLWHERCSLLLMKILGYLYA